MWMNWSLALLFLASGCVANNSLGSSAESQKNVNNLARVSIGMSEAEVLQIMRRPHTQEHFTLESDTYDVWFYVTTPTIMGQSKLMTTNLTPLSFKNGELVAIGNDYYKWIVKQEKKAADETNGQPPPKQLEDTDLEKALAPVAPPSGKTAPPPATPPSQKPKSTPPAKPKATPPKNGPTQPLSMNSRPKEKEPAVDPKEEKSKEKKKTPLTEEDDEFLDEESGQNFNFW